MISSSATQPTAEDLREQLRATKLREETIDRVSQIVGSSLDLDEVLELALKEIERAFSPKCCGIRLVRDIAEQLGSGGMCRLEGTATSVPNDTGPIDDCPFAQQAFQLHDVIVRPAGTHVPCCSKIPSGSDTDEVVVAPVTFGDLRSGAICLHLPVGTWSQDRRDLLVAMARQVGLAVRNAWLFGQAQRATRRLESTVANVGTAIVCIRPDGAVVLWSQAAARTFGYDAVEAEGQLLGELWGETAGCQLVSEIAQHATGEREGVFELAARSKSGDELSLSVSVSPVHSGKGDVDEFVLVVQDVTAARREIQLTRTFLRSALDSVDDFINIVDRDYRIIFANKAARQHAGLPEDSLFGSKCHKSYWAREEPCLHCMTIETFADSKPHHAIFDLGGDNGQPRWIERWTYPIPDSKGQAEYVIEYLRDVTEQRTQRRQLSRKVHELRQAYEQVASLNNQLLHAGKMASIGQMAASLAHQIDSPLSTIFGYASMLSKALTDERHHKWLEIMTEQADVCRRSMRNLLDFSRKPTFERSEVDLNELVDKVLSLMEYMLRVRDIEVDLGPDPAAPKVWGNEDELQQLLFNLVGNASDAMPEGGRLCITTAPRDDGSVDVAIADTGCGISPENLQRIFEPFFTTKERGQGTGLGLAVCQDIVRRHDGAIAVESPVHTDDSSQGGTKFTVTLPVAPERQQFRVSS